MKEQFIYNGHEYKRGDWVYFLLQSNKKSYASDTAKILTT